IMFGTTIERRTVAGNTATEITVSSDFSDLPTNSDSYYATTQFPAECATAANPNFCIMENSRAAAGYFDNAGNWVPDPTPVTEFCTPSNHDPDGDTSQEDKHGEACWKTMVERAGFEGLTMPDPAGAGPTVGWTEPDWIVLDKQPRFALVLDRSGSMSTGHKMEDAHYGAIYWLQYCAESNDLLTIVWYDNLIERILDLTDVAGVDISGTIDAINALTPRGTTNIRDGLYDAKSQIDSPGTRAAVQVALLLTDGKHNTPYGSSATEVIPDFQEGGISIYSLGVGPDTSVDMDVLDELAEETGGSSYAVGDDQPSVIETSMVEINAEVRGGILTTTPNIFPDCKGSDLDKVITPYLDSDKKRPPISDFLDTFGADTVGELINPTDAVRSRVISVPVSVEKACQRASFSLVYPAGNDVWLYLIDPAGNAVDMSAANVHHVISDAPHEFAIVDQPTPGKWYMLALRAKAGAAFTMQMVAGGENNQLRVFGSAQKKNCSKHPVKLIASARWMHQLSNLNVTATVVDPKGGRYDVDFTDSGDRESHTGQYSGYISPRVEGRYKGVIRIENTGKAIIARPMTRAMDAEKDSVSIKVDIPRFVRHIPFYFDSGDRPEVKDEEITTVFVVTSVVVVLAFAILSIIGFILGSLTFGAVSAALSALSALFAGARWARKV
ncbi:MAG: VWA domain-containing protein, partial [Candidatus Thorarchaeota archaeon]